MLNFPHEEEAELNDSSIASQQANTSFHAQMQSKQKTPHFALEEQQVQKQAKKMQEMWSN